MITKVKLRPMEQWCEGAQKGVRMLRLGERYRREFGDYTFIDTNSFHANVLPDCGGNAYYIDGPTRKYLLENGAAGLTVCEHMLELD